MIRTIAFAGLVALGSTLANAEACPTSATIGDDVNDAIFDLAMATVNETSEIDDARDRLAAYTLLKWDFWGRGSIGTTYAEVREIAACHVEARCGFSETYYLVGEKLRGMLEDGSWRTSSYQGVIPHDPPPSALNWARKTVGCDMPDPKSLADDLASLIFGAPADASED
ncbi:MAG: hypothetical protein CMK09_06340 [Ponticaulis sp.]|nr:hypothetical protein [Ponticaulis sp.]|tara:strand:- start:5815 stop:6321 length:507 start_codon:yes stop_codon:yes gene_type:complete